MPPEEPPSDGSIIELNFDDLSGVQDVPIQLRPTFIHLLRSVLREFQVQIQRQERPRRETSGNHAIDISSRLGKLEGQVNTLDDDGKLADQVRGFTARIDKVEDSMSAVKTVAYRFFGFAISVAATAGGVAWTMNRRSAESVGESRAMTTENRKTIDRLQHEVEIVRTMLNELLLKK